MDADVTVVKSRTLLMIKENRLLFRPACQEVAFAHVLITRPALLSRKIGLKAVQVFCLCRWLPSFRVHTDLWQLSRSFSQLI